MSLKILIILFKQLFKISPMLLGVGLVLIGIGETFGQCITTTTYTATSNWTVPAGTTSITIEAWGGGGAGGGSTDAGSGANNNRGGAGGGGGAYSTVTLSAASFSIGDIFNIVVGSGGTGVVGGNGNPGLLSSVIRGATTFVSAPGGSGGAANTAGGNPSGGTGGGTGGIGTITNGTNGINGATGSGITSGAGGNGGNGGTGGLGISGDVTTNGNPGNIIGGGGGGSRTHRNGGSPTGGSGARGEVRITYTIAANTSSSASPNQIVCTNSPLANIIHYTIGATGISNNGVAGANGLPPGVAATWSAGAITISGTPTSTAGSPYNYSIPLTGGCTTGQLAATGTITVNLQPSPTFTVTPAANICESASVTYTTQAGNSNYIWSVPGTPGIDYSITAGGIGTTNNTVTLTWLTIGSKSVSVNYTNSSGCSGSVAANNTTIVNEPPAINPTPVWPGDTKCFNTAFSPISVSTGFGYTYQWYSNDTQDYDTPNLISGATSNSYTPLTTAVGTLYYYVEVSSAGSCGTTATSAVSGAFVVNPPPVISFTNQPVGPNICVDTDVTYATLPGQSNYVWTIPGVLNVDYTITSGGHSGSDFVVLKWITAGNKAVSVNYSDANSCGATTPATSNTVNVIKNTVTAASNPHPNSCYTGAFTSITHITTLATGIGTPVGLPLGLTATWTGTAANGTIEISGTVDPSVTPGIKNYTIPLTGGCGAVAATGFIDVQPNYQLSKITSVSPSIVGGTATITIEGDPAIFTNGSYQITYSLGLSNAGSETKTVTFNNGKAVFSSLPITSEDLTSLSISQIKKATDDCFVPSIDNNITFFGIKAATFTTNSTFYVPAGIYEITIKVWGGGGGGGNGSNGAGGGGGGYSTQTIGVFPGEEIEIVIGAGGNAQTSGGASYATRDSSHPNPVASSLVYAYGGGAANGQTPGTGGSGTTAAGGNGASGNGLSGNAQIGGKGGNGGGITGGQGGLGGSGNGNSPGNDGEIPGGAGGGGKGANGGEGGNGLVLISYPLPPVGPCFRVIDDGAISSVTIIEFTCGNTTWTAPPGLLDFSTYVGGAGGGGGAGSGAGGGGAGALASGFVSSGSPYGFAANTDFTIRVGEGGQGAQTNLIRGFRGEFSSIAGTVGGTPVLVAAEGGGGGGSEFSILGENGISGSHGGGGGANNTAEGFGGTSSGSGRAGGNGDFSTDQAFAGGGGAGVAEVGGEGKGAGLGQGEGGKGGNGVAITMGDSTRYFGAGGGGVGFNFNGTQKIGLGGTAPNGTKIGGDGNLTGVNPAGSPGVDKTGSGGGAGYGTGGKGGNGVVYIYYYNYSILGVEYQYFTADYNPQNRTGNLNWSTTKEWDNSHFEIERAVNDTKSWETIGQVTGAGYSDQPVDYSYQDINLPLAGGNIFYRLKQVDFDGKYSYSVTRAIQVEPVVGTTYWRVYPNPTTGDPINLETLDTGAYNDELVTVRVISVTGQFEVVESKAGTTLGQQVSDVLRNKSAGIYTLEISWGVFKEYHKVILRR